MGSGCSTTCEKGLRANCGWRNSIPGAASRCCRALPLQRLGLDPTEVTTFRRTAVRSLWRAPLDRRSPPRQIPNIEGEQPVFGATGEIFFRRAEGTSSFLFRVQEGGGQLRKAFDVPIVALSSESPDHNWLALGTGGVTIFRVDGGAPLRTEIKASSTTIKWSGDGKHV